MNDTLSSVRYFWRILLRTGVRGDSATVSREIHGQRRSYVEPDAHKHLLEGPAVVSDVSSQTHYV